ncbi:MAG: hypothetical protein ANABAC_1318 [Anaerolineae bacterium]|nr:MAG: hypothetical protein ANABAC_1318 [Anaerolineae bacterium]
MKKTDLNHTEIREGLRKAGYFVWDTHELGRGFPDLLVVSKAGVIVLLEVKSPRGKMTPDEQRFYSCFPGHLAVVQSLEEALEYLNKLDYAIQNLQNVHTELTEVGA